MRPFPLAGALLLLLLPTVGAQREEYLGQPVGVGCYAILEEGDCPDVANSRVQLGPLPKARRAGLAIDDASGLDVGGAYLWVDASGRVLAEGSFCGRARDVAVPRGALHLVVDVDAPYTPAHCATPMFGTAGDVRLHLR